MYFSRLNRPTKWRMNTNPNDMRAHVMKIQNSENKKKSLNISRKEKKKNLPAYEYLGIKMASDLLRSTLITQETM